MAFCSSEGNKGVTSEGKVVSRIFYTLLWDIVLTGSCLIIELFCINKITYFVYNAVYLQTKIYPVFAMILYSNMIKHEVL